VEKNLKDQTEKYAVHSQTKPNPSQKYVISTSQAGYIVSDVYAVATKQCHFS
jgi:hypothetical protein